MTGAKKVLLLLVLEVAALGGAFGGGFYIERVKRQAAEKQLSDAKSQATAAEDLAVKTLAIARARTQLLEATLGVEHQNFGMAFDRVVRTQALMRRVGRSFDKEFDELNQLLMEQKQEALVKLVDLAEKIEPAPGLGLPKTTAAPKAGAPAPSPPTAPAAAAPGQPPPQGPASRDYQDGRESLRLAKELLLTGGELTEIARKLARAQVLLNESGYTQLDDELGSAIKAAKSRDEAKVRSAVDAALNRLRTP
jgi:hypothetical protein